MHLETIQFQVDNLTLLHVELHKSTNKDCTKALLILHGLGDHCQRFRSIIETIYTHPGSPYYEASKVNGDNKDFKDVTSSEKRVSLHVLAFDQRGHGETLKLNRKTQQPGHIEGGLEQSFKDIDAIIQEILVAQLNVKEIMLFGHSMGGLVSFEYCSSRRNSLISKVLLSAPLFSPAFPVNPIKFHGGKLLATILPRMLVSNDVPVEKLTHVQSVIDEYKSDPLVHHKVSLSLAKDLIDRYCALMKMKKIDFNLPILIAHGDADNITSFDASKKIFEALVSPSKSFLPFPGLYHECTSYDYLHSLNKS